MNYVLFEKTNTFHSIEIVDSSHVFKNYGTYRMNGAVNFFNIKHHFRQKIKVTGLSGRNKQNSFSIACAMSHRRIWEDFLYSNNSHALVFEKDAYPTKNNVLNTVRYLIANYSQNWDIINLGRCKDFCLSTRNVSHFEFDNNRFNIISSNAPSCTHAYLISKKGAEILRRWSIPYITSVDYLMQLLSRTNKLTLFSLVPSLFVQKKQEDAHDNTNDECDKNEKKILNMIQSVSDKDQNTLNFVKKSKLFNWYNYIDYKPYNQTSNDFSKYCRVMKQTNESFKASPKIEKLLYFMDIRNLTGFVIWGLYKNVSHTHTYIHDAIYKTFWDVFKFSKNHKKICWFPDSWRGNIPQNSIVFSSPKHMQWKQFNQKPEDPVLQYLPLNSKNFYIFHELIPPRFYKLPMVAQWIVKGPDGNVPAFDSEHYILRKKYQCNDLLCTFPNVIVAPWAAFHAHEKFHVNQRSKNVNFVGTIWKTNYKEFCEFVKGCNHMNITVIRYGLQPNHFYKNCPSHINIVRKISNTEKWTLMSQSKFIPAFQGKDHLQSFQNSYIPDRIFASIASNLKILTNNRLVSKQFNITYSSPYNMCRQNVDKIITKHSYDIISNHHTYIDRFLQIFDSIELNEK